MKQNTKPAAKSVEATLKGRKSTHGDFTINAQIAQDLKAVLHASPNWPTLSADKKEALEMVMHKAARICTGNPNEPDHWHDISGYAKLSEDRCET